MNTPAGFEPAFTAPPELAADAVCFVWRDDKILVRAGEPPTLPTFTDFTRLSIDGARHYLGRLEGIDCMAIRVAADTQAANGAGCARSSSRYLIHCSRLPVAPSRSSNGIAAISSADAAGRGCATGPASGRRSVPSAGMSSTRAYRRQ